MAIAVEIPREYGYVVLFLILYAFINFWMGVQVQGVYPALYAMKFENKDAKLFNYVQRGHQNSLEMMSVFFAMLLIGGFQHPVIIVALNAFYTISKFFYFKGYATGVPENRLKIGYGGLNFLAMFGLIICPTSFRIHLIIQEVL